MLLKSGFSLHVDGAKIALATKLGQTSSRQPGRGKGFETMKKAVRACDEGELLVVSNGGYYIYSQDEEEQFGSLDVPIEGTLIQWRVKHASSTMRINDEDENDIGREGF